MGTLDDRLAARTAEIREMSFDQHLAAAADLMARSEAAGPALAGLTAAQRATAHLNWAGLKLAAGGYMIVR